MPVSYSMRFFDRSFDWLSTSGLRILFIAIGTRVLLALLTRALAKLRSIYEGTIPNQAQITRAYTLTHIVRDVARIGIFFIGVTMILSELAIDLTPLPAAAGLGGLAIGFGAQTLVKDLISGFFILLENSVRVGDVVEVAGVS